MAKAAGDLDICIVNRLEFGSMDHEDIVNNLIASPTDVVVVFAEMDDMRKLLEAKNRIGNADILIKIVLELCSGILQMAECSRRRIIFVHKLT